ncbi:MAG: protein containing DUF424 [Candidatus Syntrophoarchaeum caldarius]|uniref:Protein containing DUF424 n=1 Tax=Candidatus Syntropharchaeum caldarium TaxID=1838285 RepID=A0A1F2P7T1_9EURY|nr:MAG: protein containing DUF424 [Candidatus Syntrophoarchaeum caldarius]
MYLKIHEVDGKKVVAVCDRALLGRSFEDGEISVEITERFYKGEIASRSEVISVLQDAENVNLFGDMAVGCAIESGLIDEEGIIRIAGIPHAQIFVI